MYCITGLIMYTEIKTVTNSLELLQHVIYFH